MDDTAAPDEEIGGYRLLLELEQPFLDKVKKLLWALDAMLRNRRRLRPAGSKGHGQRKDSLQSPAADTSFGGPDSVVAAVLSQPSQAVLRKALEFSKTINSDTEDEDSDASQLAYASPDQAAALKAMSSTMNKETGVALIQWMQRHENLDNIGALTMTRARKVVADFATECKELPDTVSALRELKTRCLRILGFVRHLASAQVAGHSAAWAPTDTVTLCDCFLRVGSALKHRGAIDDSDLASAARVYSVLAISSFELLEPAHASTYGYVSPQGHILLRFLDLIARNEGRSDLVAKSGSPSELMRTVLSVDPVTGQPQKKKSGSSALELELKSDLVSRHLNMKEATAYFIKRLRALSNATRDETKPEQPAYLEFPFFLNSTAKGMALRLLSLHTMAEVDRPTFTNSASLLMARAMEEAVDAPEAAELQVKPNSCSQFLAVRVRRGFEEQDASHQILPSLHPQAIHRPLKVQYIEGGEIGLDLGGVSKEFFHAVVHSMLDPKRGLFVFAPDGLYWPNAAAPGSADHEYFVAGVMLGLACYNNVVIPDIFPLPFYDHLLEQEPCPLDIWTVDETLAQSLTQILRLDAETLEALDMTFTVSIGGKPFCLGDNNEDLPVTKDNLLIFAQRYVAMVLSGSVKRQMAAVRKGLSIVIPPEQLSLCKPAELRQIMCGSDVIDVEQLLESAQLIGFQATDNTIQWLTDYVRSLSQTKLHDFVKFVTGSRQIPVHTKDNLVIAIQNNGTDDTRLPTSMTCFSRLLLPTYRTQERLRRSMDLALEHHAGFGLV